MELTQQEQIATYLSHLDALMRRGRDLRDKLAANPSDSPTISATRAWQEDCGVTINQLSGGSKAHWLARSFSGAFLMRSSDGQAVEGAAPAEIVTRLLGVLEQAVATLSGIGDPQNASGQASASSEGPPPHRFDFVHNSELRPVLEQAYIDSRRALDQQDYDQAMRTSCGILEAIVTDALTHKGLAFLVVSGAPTEKISDWSFGTRLVVAERAGLIRSGCARLPTVARTYRDHANGESESGVNAGDGPAKISEREARLASQVLNVIMRDLDPGR